MDGLIYIDIGVTPRPRVNPHKWAVFLRAGPGGLEFAAGQADNRSEGL